jgi:hypothetical protein
MRRASTVVFIALVLLSAKATRDSVFAWNESNADKNLIVFYQKHFKQFVQLNKSGYVGPCGGYFTGGGGPIICCSLQYRLICEGPGTTNCGCKEDAGCESDCKARNNCGVVPAGGECSEEEE